MSTKFISDEFEKAIIINVIDVTFQKLNQKQKNMLTRYLYGAIQMIASCYDFYSDLENFDKKLRQNDYKDLRWLITFLIPYVDQSRRSLCDLTDLEELYSLRYDTVSQEIKQRVSDLKIEDINFVEPKYIFSNLQYGRCIRNNISDGGNKSITFNKIHIEDNYYLLLDTIKTTRYKLYINWIDILPYRMDNYNVSKLFISTKKKLDKRSYRMLDPVVDYPIHKYNNDKQINILNGLIKGLNVEDIYNTLRVDLYESVIIYKWLLFEITFQYFNNSNTITMNTTVIQMLNVMMSMTMFYTINDISWDDITLVNQEKIGQEWDKMILIFKDKLVVMLNTASTIDINAINTIMKSIIVFFDKKYSNENTIFKENSYINLDHKTIRKSVDDYDEHMKDVPDHDALVSLISIKHFQIYDFFRESIQGFKTLWYSRYIMNPEKTEILSHYEYGYKQINDKLTVSLYNIYDFCKCIVRKKKPIHGSKLQKTWDSATYFKFSESWYCLNKETKEIFIDRLNVMDTDWFVKNIIVNKVIAEIRNNLSYILFESMISRGTMSYMVAEIDLTDNDTYDMTQSLQKLNFVNDIKARRFYDKNPYGQNSYYYLTNKPFNETGTYYVDIENNIKDYNYFDICSTVSTAWYIATTYHWIAQIGFCHRFINNRVNFITGGTGAGKTTQVPKMYIYYLKAIDRIENPIVLITVPKTSSATEISYFVSKELAVPYREIDKVTKQIQKTTNTNHYIQFQYMKDDNISIGNYPIIRFVTDGSVLLDAKDPLLKNKQLLKNKNDLDDKNSMYVYHKTNKYDVVMIDEAHEHNTNMDMILSLMKNSIHNNNKMRLVIMSATMDTDEPVYRRFYRDINDNRKYPLSDWIKENKIDRINTERRFHISPPGETTRYKITEIYRPDEDADQLVQEIIKTTTSGDILLFRPGIAEIRKSILVLNAIGFLPYNVIAIPYHAQLRNAKDFINKIIN